jgi:NAD(P)-dependent dehydrogenase (short-subunit alcohol dehydrogenase family)
MKGLRGKIALVTGASRGIGAATFVRLREEGATVIGTDLSPSTDDILQHDVAREESWAAIHSHVADQHGTLDILVNVAGILREAPLAETTENLWDGVVNTNLKGTFLGCRQFVDLLSRDGGAIINLASIDGLRGSFNHIAYAATKGGIAAMSRAMAVELADRGIRVNALAPGTVDTPLVQKMLSGEGDVDAARKKRGLMHPLGRISTAEEQAAAIAFLASEEASSITGVTLSVDGGRAIR